MSGGTSAFKEEHTQIPSKTLMTICFVIMKSNDSTCSDSVLCFLIVAAADKQKLH